MLVHLADTRLNRASKRLQHLQSFPQRNIPLSLKLRVPLHILNGHAGSAQFHQKLYPANIILRIAAMRVLRTVYRVNEANTLIIAQRMYAQASCLSNLFDGEISVCHNANSITQKLPQVKLILGA